MVRQVVQSTKIASNSQNEQKDTWGDTDFVEQLVPKVSFGDLTEEQQILAKCMLHKQRDILCVNKDESGYAEGLKSTINLTDKTPVAQHYHAVPRPLHRELKQFMEDLFNQEFIEKSQSPYSSCCVMARKRGLSIKLV